MDTKNIKIAFVTDDGSTISQHFGRAQYYEVLTVENGAVTHRERREKAGHHTFAGNESHHEHHGEGHGLDDASRGKHLQMAETIKDCGIMLARGMGNGAYQHLMAFGIQPVLTTIPGIDDAAKAVIQGTIEDHPERLH
jgi:predicted Fe-Mo cluster-binding NifX family protein